MRPGTPCSCRNGLFRELDQVITECRQYRLGNFSRLERKRSRLERRDESSLRSLAERAAICRGRRVGRLRARDVRELLAAEDSRSQREGAAVPGRSNNFL